VLSVRDLHVYYGLVRAVCGVSLDVRVGEIVTLIGNNGAGKTSTLKAIYGLVPVVRGSIKVGGANVVGWKAHRVAHLGVGYVPEGRRIFTQLTVRENLEMGAWGRSDKREIRRDMDYVVSLFPVLGQRWNQKGGTLSGGEQQMLAIGRALMSRPQLLLMDEPSLGLGPLVVQQVFEAIVGIRDRGVSILVAEQNARASLSIADRAYLMETGRIVLEGEAKQLLDTDLVRKTYLGAGGGDAEESKCDLL